MIYRFRAHRLALRRLRLGRMLRPLLRGRCRLLGKDAGINAVLTFVQKVMVDI